MNYRGFCGKIQKINFFELRNAVFLLSLSFPHSKSGIQDLSDFTGFPVKLGMTEIDIS